MRVPLLATAVVLLMMAGACREDRAQLASGSRAGGLSSSEAWGFGTPASGPQAAVQKAPSAAFDGVNHLVVWTDYRRGDQADLFGARVSVGGQVLDPQGKALVSQGGEQVDPAIAYGGTQYLLTWADSGSGEDDIYAARIGPDGTVLDPEGIRVCTVTGQQRTPAVAFDGTNFLIVWLDGRNGPERVYGTRVTPAGQVLEPGGVLLSHAWATSVTLAFNAPEYLVVVNELMVMAPVQYRVSAVRVTPAGEVLAPALTIAPSVERGQTGVAALGAGFLVAWLEAATGRVSGRRLGAGGVMDAQPLSLSGSGRSFAGPRVVASGAEALVAWDEAATPRVGRVSPEGVVLDPGGIALPSAPPGGRLQIRALAEGAGEILVVVEDGQDVFATRASSSATPLDPSAVLLSTSGTTQRRPVVAATAGAYLVLREEQGALVASWESAGLAQVPDGGLRVSAGQARVPQVAVAGDRTLAVWEEASDAGTFMTSLRAGLLEPGLGPSPISLPASTLLIHPSPVVASNGSGFLLAWNEFDGLWAAKVSGEGRVPGDGGRPLAGRAVASAAGSDGTDFLVVWTEQSSAEIRASRISSEGVVLDADGGFRVAGLETSSELDLAFDGTSYLAVWQDIGFGQDIRAARISPAGEVLDEDGLSVCAELGDQTSPAVAFDGARFQVVWRDRHEGVDQLFGAHVLGDGSVSAPERLAEGRAPDLAFGTQDAGLLVYERFDEAAGATRIQARWLRQAPEDAGTAASLAFEFFSPPPARAQCGHLWSTSAAKATSGSAVAAFRLLEAPEGVTVEPQSGALRWQPTREQAGVHLLRLEASAVDGLTATREVTVEVFCPVQPATGCQCAQPSAAAWLWIGAGAFALASARRRQRAPGAGR